MQTNATFVSATFSDMKLTVQLSNPDAVSYLAGYSLQKVVDVFNSLPPKPITPDETAAGKVPWVAPEHYFSEMIDGEGILLSNRCFTAIKEAQPIQGRNIAVVTGEAGLLACLPELSRLTRVILQIEDNPAVLLMTNAILNLLPQMGTPERYSDVIRSAFQVVKRQIPQIEDSQPQVVELFEDYLDDLPGQHCCSSGQRLHQTCEALKRCVVIPVRASYFNATDMVMLNHVLHECDLVFLNLSNAATNYLKFCREHPFDGRVKSICSTQLIKSIPVKPETLCTYSFLEDSSKPLLRACPGDSLVSEMERIMKDKAFGNILLGIFPFKTGKDIKSVLEGRILKLDRTSDAELEAKVVAELRNMIALLSWGDLKVLRNHLMSLDNRFRHRPPNDPVRRLFMRILEAACLEAEAATVYC